MRSLIIHLVLLYSLASMLHVAAQPPLTQVGFPAWTPPVARDKTKTPFSPKPVKGDNIFKGEAEGWLAQAILDREIGRLSEITDKDVSDYISRLGQHLVLHSTASSKAYRFVVVRSYEENAFSIGAGRIYINLGMLQAVESEDELVSVLAHEIAHDAFLHAPQTVTRQMFWMTGTRKVASLDETKTALDKLLAAYGKNTFAAVGENLLGWSRFRELEADKAGFYNMYKAGYNPGLMKTVFRRYVREEKREAGDDYAATYFLTLLFGSHPPSSQRVTALKWESLWIRMPPSEERYKSAAFDGMKARVAKM